MTQASGTVEMRLRLSSERAEQLRAVAESFGLSEEEIVSRALERFLSEIENGDGRRKESAATIGEPTPDQTMTERLRGFVKVTLSYEELDELYHRR